MGDGGSLQIPMLWTEVGGGEKQWAIPHLQLGDKGRGAGFHPRSAVEVEPTEGLEPGGASEPQPERLSHSPKSVPGQLGRRLGDGGGAIPVPSNAKIRLDQ